MIDRRLNAVEISIRKLGWHEIDLEEISHFTHKHGKGIYRNAADVSGIQAYLSRIESRFPSEAIFLAFLDNDLMGWAALDRNGETMAELGRWQPVIRESEIQDEVAKTLLEAILSYSRDTGITHLEAMLSEVDRASEMDYQLFRKWFNTVNMPLLADDAYLLRNLNEGEIEQKTLPEHLEILGLDGINESDLYKCYYDTFLSSEDSEFLNMNESQRREKFDSSYKSPSLNRGLSCVIVDESKIIGFAFYLTRDSEEHLDRFGIREEYRGQGIGKALLLHTMRKAKSKGISLVSLGVDTSNRSAFNLYKNLGFIVESRMIIHYKTFH